MAVYTMSLMYGDCRLRLRWCGFGGLGPVLEYTMDSYSDNRTRTLRALRPYICPGHFPRNGRAVRWQP